MFVVTTVSAVTLAAFAIFSKPEERDWVAGGMVFVLVEATWVLGAGVQLRRERRRKRLRASGIRIDATVLRFAEDDEDHSVSVEVCFTAPDGVVRQGIREWPGDVTLPFVIPIVFVAGEQGRGEDWDCEVNLFCETERPANSD